MTTLKVRMHWSRQPSNLVPPAIRAYGTAPDMVTSPVWSTLAIDKGPVAPNLIYHVWCPLVAQSALDDPMTRWGANTNSPPPSWEISAGVPLGTNIYDEGYKNPNATDFKVTALRLWLNQGNGNDFSFTIIAPNGNIIGAITPTARGWTDIPLNQTISSGKGIWKIDIDRAIGSTVSAPRLEIGLDVASGGVDEPFVSPYGSMLEGILGLEFTGEEIFETSITVTPSVTVGACAANGNRLPSILTVTFTPPLPSLTTYSVYWADGISPPTTVPMPPGTVATGATLSSLMRSANYLGGNTYYPSASVTYTVPGGQVVTVFVSFTTPIGAANGTVVIDQCPATVPKTCYDIHVSHSGPQSPCIKGSGQSVTVDFTAEITPATPPYMGRVTWQVRDSATNNLLPLPSPTPTDSNLTFKFDQKGRYKVTATLDVQAGCNISSQPNDVDIIDIVDCECPSIIGSPKGIEVTKINGCSFSFSIQINNPSTNSPTITWNFDDGTGPHVGLGSSVNWDYPALTSGKKNVTVTVTNSDPSCSDMATAGVEVKCDEPIPPDDTPPPPPPPSGGFDLCCFLIWWWGLSHLVTGSLLYFGLWVAGIISAAIATIVLAIWIGVCCWPCALRFWQCCTLLKWVIMFNDALVVTLFGIYALGGAGNPWVLAAFGLVSTLCRAAMSASKCGTIPNIFDPTTWPPCRCP